MSKILEIKREYLESGEHSEATKQAIEMFVTYAIVKKAEKNKLRKKSERQRFQKAFFELARSTSDIKPTAEKGLFKLASDIWASHSSKNSEGKTIIDDKIKALLEKFESGEDLSKFTFSDPDVVKPEPEPEIVKPVVPVKESVDLIEKNIPHSLKGARKSKDPSVFIEKANESKKSQPRLLVSKKVK